jgi:hypothetical protein
MKKYYRYYLLERIKEILRQGSTEPIHKKFFTMDKTHVMVYRLKQRL